MRRTVLLLCAVLIAIPGYAQERPRNLILMIADGFGPASATMARTAAGLPLALDAILTGSVATGATDSRVIDSAAAATAFACGIKTYNGAIAVDTLRAPCRTILEAAEERGMATGLVSTSRLTHATPASFAAHVPHRLAEDEIARQMVDQGIEVLFGGGRLKLVDVARTHIASRREFSEMSAVPAWAFFADSHLAYEIDRSDDVEPSLSEMTRKALELLSRSDDGRANGFFVMIEGGRIDHAAHDNDPAAHLHDILAYDEAVAVALEFARSNGNTLVVSTADHETGGLALGRESIYDWDPEYLMAVRSSFEAMAALGFRDGTVYEFVREHLAIDELTDDERTVVEGLVASNNVDRTSALSIIESRRAGIGWTTGGHTAVDVGLYSFGPGSELFRGQLENDELGRRLFQVLGL